MIIPKLGLLKLCILFEQKSWHCIRLFFLFTLLVNCIGLTYAQQTSVPLSIRVGVIPSENLFEEHQADKNGAVTYSAISMTISPKYQNTPGGFTVSSSVIQLKLSVKSFAMMKSISAVTRLRRKMKRRRHRSLLPIMPAQNASACMYPVTAPRFSSME